MARRSCKGWIPRRPPIRISRRPIWPGRGCCWLKGSAIRRVKELAAARAAHPDAIDAAEIDYRCCLGCRVAWMRRAKALETLTRLTPADATRFRELAELKLAERQFQEAAQNYEAAARWSRIKPTFGTKWVMRTPLPGIWRMRGGRWSVTGSCSGQSNFNALDSLGEVNFFLGDFSSAEKYFLEAQEKNPRCTWN